MEENRGLVILEKSMYKRFGAMAKIHGFHVFHADLNNFLSGDKGENFIKRVKSKKKLTETSERLDLFIVENELNRVYFSTAEGYASHNLIYNIKRKYPSIEYVALQHGLFPHSYSKSKENFRKLFNNLFKLVFGIFPFGAGFGGILLDQYYVYSETEKQFLIKHRNWNFNQVHVKLEFIKADVFLEFKNREIKQDEKCAIFLPQCLSAASLCTYEQEVIYNTGIINILSKKYDKLYLKEHPACLNFVNQNQIPENVILVDDMFDGFVKCKTAYSYFSTALLDAKIFNLKTVGIFVKGLKVDPQIYKTFDTTLNFEDFIST